MTTREETMVFEDWKRLNNQTPEILNYFVDAFDTVYFKDEAELKGLFSDHNDLNFELIGKRVRRLNALYHTRLWDKHIKALIGVLSSEGSRIENKIKDGNVDVVEQIARCGGEKWFAFATKYCSFVNPGEYPIYDSLVTKPLVEFNKKNPFTDEKLDFERIRQECNYGKYKGIVTAFRDKYCEGREYKDIDKFLWIVGKNM